MGEGTQNKSKPTQGPFDLKALLAAAPNAPGVYIMKDRRGEVIYVGKSVDLKARLRSYFSGSDRRPFVTRLPRLLGDIQTVVTRDEVEALRLEAALIRGHKPRYNILLVRNSYWLRLDEGALWPMVEVVKEVSRDGARYFGEYRRWADAKEMARLLNHHFVLRTCNERDFQGARRPCFEYEVKRCEAPCVRTVARAAYTDRVGEALLFLDGQYDELRLRLEDKMLEASGREAFEAAARYRDMLKSVAAASSRHKIVATDNASKDAFGLFRQGEHVSVQVLSVRGGRLMHTHTFPYRDQPFNDEGLLSSFIAQFYGADGAFPDEILLPWPLASGAGLQDHLSTLAGHPVTMSVPSNTESIELVEMASRSARHSFEQHSFSPEGRPDLLESLQKRLGLRNRPLHIECCDISNLQGEAMVGAIVVFKNGRAAPKSHMRFKIKEVVGPNDFACIREVLRRRFEAMSANSPLPDLLVIDGGKGQLGAAESVLKDLEIDSVDLVSLAKARPRQALERANPLMASERVFMSGMRDPIVLRPNSAELFLLQRVRDEAHDQALAHHRRVRRRGGLRGSLDQIPGVGPKRHKSLLRHFGSVERVKGATVDDLAEVEGIGRGLAENIVRTLKHSASPRPR